jgi:molybdopterin-synthase adenylyltransferase
MFSPSLPSTPSDSIPLVNRLRELAVDDDSQPVVPLAAIQTASAEFSLTRREVELAAVEAHLLPWRHKRNLGTVGWAGLARLMRCSAAVVGLGGLGGYVVEGLARMGVGHLILMDGDVFAEHNLNRQLFSSEANIGRSKAEAARERVAQINSAVEMAVYDSFVTAETLPARLQGADVVVDCTDQLPIRITLQDAAARAGIPMVHGAIAGYIGQVMTIMPGDEGLRALYGGDVPERGLEVELGNPAATPMMIAAWQVQETIKVLLGIGQPLCRRMLFMDAESGTADIIALGCE